MALFSSLSPEELINFFNILFYIFVGLAVLGFVLAIFIFFYFDIPSVYSMMTGKARRDTIRRMQEENFKTGKLQFQYPKHTGETRHSGKIGKTGRTGAKKRTASQPAVVESKTELPQTYETGVLHVELPETVLLQHSPPEMPAPYSDSGETVPLKAADRERYTCTQPQVDAQIRFQITENTMVIHTNEFI